MRNILLILCLFLSFTTKAQVVPGGIESKDLLRFGNYQSPTPAKFRLYPTSNRYTYLRLNTITGFIDIVQYSTTNAEDRMIYPLSTSPPLMSLFNNGTLDRYTIYPTQNVYNFLLLDQVEGNTYQVQWSQDSTMRGVEEIRKKE
jgi:hypothetical protein